MRRILLAAATLGLLSSGCAANGSEPPVQPQTSDVVDTGQQSGAEPVPESSADGAADAVTEFETVEHAQLSSPWALEFLPGTDLLLITERTGAIQLRDQDSGEIREISGVPEVSASGQGGMHDVIAAPSFAEDGTVYLSWVRASEQGSQGVVARARLDPGDAALQDLEVIWQQDPAAGDGHFSLRLAIWEDHLFIISGDRQQMEPAQDTSTDLGAVVRLSLDGDPAPAEEFTDAKAEGLWSIGHRNPLGIAAGSSGQLWSSEMGPAGGDELNLLRAGANYGWPEVSMGEHYDGTAIPDHAAGDGFEAPRAWWVPAISPGNVMIYQGEMFTGWQDSAVLGGLSGQNLVRVQLDGGIAEPVDQWDMGARIRAVEEAPDGSIWVATDSGALLELRPA